MYFFIEKFHVVYLIIPSPVPPKLCPSPFPPTFLLLSLFQKQTSKNKKKHAHIHTNKNKTKPAATTTKTFQKWKPKHKSSKIERGQKVYRIS